MMHRLARITVITLAGIVAATAGLAILRSRPVYTETATVIFTLPSTSPVETYGGQVNSLIATGSVVSQVVMGPQIAAHIKKAGGVASYDLAMVNLYNDDYPDFGYPEASLTVSSASAASTHQTFLIARRMLRLVLAGRQRQAGARPRRRIAASVIGDTGPVAEAGSRKRAMAGLVLLALVGGGAAWNLMRPAGIHHRD
jgi:hypothetical protein